MASVQELLLAAQARDKSPFIGLLEGVARGYQQAQSQELERSRVLVQMEQERQDRERAAETHRTLMAQLAGSQEDATQRQLGAAATPKRSAHPGMRLAGATVGAEGYLKPRFDVVPTPEEPAVKNIQGVDYIVTKTAQGIPHYQPIPERTPSQSEQVARQYADKAQQANESLIRLTEGGYRPTTLSMAAQGRLPTAVQSKEFQQLDQARRQFINSVLRRESGAAISASEYENYTRQYFPVAGDSPEVLEQKSASRELAIKGLAGEGRRVKSNLPGEEGGAPPPPSKGGIKILGVRPS